MILETERLYLREMQQADYNALCKMLMDKDVMYAYEHAFSEEEAHHWLDRQLIRYKQDGFGLWAVILKQTDEMIGQCGITLQTIMIDQSEQIVHEIGYLFTKQFWGNGYAIESARACKEYAFTKLDIDEIYSIIRDSNIASQAVAKHNDMTVKSTFTKHYYGVDMPHLVYSIKRI